MQFHVFGAGAGIGKWFVLKGLCHEENDHIYAYDTNKRALDNINRPGIIKKFLDTDRAIKGDYLREHFGDVHPGDWILLAVPERNLEDLCEKISIHIPDDCFIGVMTSRQEEPLKKVSQLIPKAKCCGLHPLFGPTVISPHGQIVALCHNEKDSSMFNEIKKSLYKCGLIVVEIAPEQHDLFMSYIQALTHFTLFAFGGVISRQKIEMGKLINLKTPPFQFLSAFFSRIMMGNLETYASIQKSKYADIVRKEFISISKELDEIFESDIQKIVEFLEKIRDPFDGAIIDELSQLSFIANSAIQGIEKYYFNVMRNKDIIVFKTPDKDIYRVGYITECEPRFLYISEILTRFNINGSIKIPIPFNDTAILNYRKNGINIRFSKKIKIKKSKITLLSKDGVNEWISDNLMTLTSNITTTNPMNLSEEVFEEWLPKFIQDIKHCQFIESYKKRGELPKATINIEYYPDRDLKNIKDKIRAFCYNFKPI